MYCISQEIDPKKQSQHGFAVDPLWLVYLVTVQKQKLISQSRIQSMDLMAVY